MSRTQLGRQEEEQVVKVSIRCEDCGNQAKKDCAYSRCRTCCKNKGFHCQTHIASTWIPVDRRRQRMDSTNTNQHHHHHLQVNQLGDIPQRHNKRIPFTSLEDQLKFPGVMSSMAAFSCVRVRSVDDTVNEIAYQTSVKIGGHVFSGLLYDQGPDQQQSFNNNAIVDPQDHHHQRNNLNLFGSAAIHTTTRTGATAATASTMAPVLSATTSTATHHHQLFYPPPHPLANSFRPGMPYFPHPKP